MLASPIRLLLLEDDRAAAEALAELVAAALPSGAVAAADTLAAAVSLAGRRFDAALVDLGLPDSQGLETLRQIRLAYPETAIIVVSGRDERELVERAMAEGAQDYLVKGAVTGDTLVRSILGAIERQKLLLAMRWSSERLRANEAQLRQLVEASPDAVLVTDETGVVRFANRAAVAVFEGEQLLGTVLGVPIVGERPVELDLVGGSGRVVEAWSIPLEWAGAPARLFSLHDITSRRAAQVAIEQRVRQQAAVAELASRAVSVPELDTVFALAADVVAITLSVDLVALGQIDGSAEVVVRSAFGLPPGLVGTRLPVGSLSAHVVAHRGSIVIEDLETDARISIHPGLASVGARSGMAAPVPGGEGLWGTLVVFARQRRRFSVDDVRFLEAIAGVIGAAVTRAHLEQRLRDQEARFRSVVESLGEGVMLSDLERITYVNPALAELAGTRADELVGMAMSETPFLDPLAGDLERRKRDRRRGLSEIWESEMRRSDGRPLWMRIHGGPFRDASGQIVGTVAVFSDLTERRAAERAREDAERRLRDVLAHSGAVLYSLSPGPPVQLSWISESASNVLGFAAEDLRLQPGLFESRLHPDDAGTTTRVLSEIPEGGPVVKEYRFRHASGRTVWLRDTLTVVRGPDGLATEAVGICLDVTAERQLLQELRQAQKMEAIGRLAGGIAHDFNNLLTAIGGYSELLLMRLPVDDPARFEVEEIRKAGERAAALTRQLLAFSRRQVVQPRVLELNQVVTETERMLRRLIGEEIELRTVLARQPLAVRADPGQLEQVLVNLVVNARDAMPRGGRVTVATSTVALSQHDSRHPDARPGRWCVLQVADTGTGIEPDVLAHLFEPFFTTKEMGKGTGLGLSTVYGIARQSGGWIEVDTAVGRGSTFSVYLPAEATEATARERNPPAEVTRSGGETILVAEDDPLVRSLVSRTLRAHGYQVLEAASGKEALAQWERCDGRVDLLLSDVVMPDLRGPELRARLLERRPSLPTILMSGYNEEGLGGAAHPGGGFLHKPFRPDDLARAVRAQLDARGATP